MKLMPAVYCGVMMGIELWTILEPIMPHHPQGSTVSRETIESYGFTIEEKHGPLL